MGASHIMTGYLIPLMVHIIVVAAIAAVLKKKEITLGYQSAIGVVLIVLAGVSSALWGVLFQCRYNGTNFLEILKAYIDIRQPAMSYLLVLVFMLIIFSGNTINKNVRWAPVLLFLKALIVGGIEEIGWRYTFQPVMEKTVTYVPAVLITFICWGIWHLLFFYIDDSLAEVNVLWFLLGLLNNCFVLSALYACTGSLWICVMTHALINALSQITEDKTENKNWIISISRKVACAALAISLYYFW